MIAACALFGLAVVMGAFGGGWLRGAKWPRRAPRLGIYAWQALSFSTVAATVLAGASLALPAVPMSVTSDIASLLGACAIALREHYSAPGGLAAGVFGAALVFWVGSRVVRCFGRCVRDVHSERRRQRHAIGLVARDDVVPGALVIDDARPAVYCIPGRRPMVVLTAAALDALSGQQRDLVLAHEHAHLACHHDVVLIAAASLRRAFPFVPVFRIAATEVATLIEMHADDQALCGGDRRALAAALVNLAGGPHPVGALGAAGGSAVARLERLVEGPRDLARSRTWVIKAGIAMVLAIPVFVAAAPGLETALLDYCSIDHVW